MVRDGLKTHLAFVYGLVPKALERLWRGVAQPGSASALGAEGRVFESRRPDQTSLARAREACQRIEEARLRARIFMPAKTAMQSGKARTKAWVLEYEPAGPRTIDALMGWTSSADMLSQVQLEFDSREEAIAYAEKHGIAFYLFEPHRPALKPRAYADNFRYDRKVPWSH